MVYGIRVGNTSFSYCLYWKYQQYKTPIYAVYHISGTTKPDTIFLYHHHPIFKTLI